MKTPEGELKAKVDKLLKEIGAYSFSPVQMGMGKRTVDRLCCINGRFVAIELKAPGKEPTKLQYKCMDEIREAGGHAFWADNMNALCRQLYAASLIDSVTCTSAG